MTVQETNGSAPTVEEDQPVRDYACRTEGCENRANAKWGRGALSGLCWEVCVPAARLHMAAVARRRGVASAVRVVQVPDVRVLPEPPGRPPDPDPPVEDRAEEREPSLADLAYDLERARLARDTAESDYEDALEAFLDHPIIVELDLLQP